MDPLALTTKTQFSFRFRKENKIIESDCNCSFNSPIIAKIGRSGVLVHLFVFLFLDTPKRKKKTLLTFKTFKA
jgi:hypothetical protein